MLTIILSLTGLLLLVLSAVVLYSNYRSATNRWLAAFTLSGLLWLLANLGANLSTTQHTNLMFSRAALIGAALLPFAYLLFCVHFTKAEVRMPARIGLFLPIALLLLSVPTSYNIVRVTGQNFAIQPGIAYAVLLLVLVVYFSYGMHLLLADYRRAKLARRQQLYYILFGTVLTVVPGFILSGLLPLLDIAAGTTAAPVVSAFFSIFTALAIIKHQLLDVRLVIARSLAYAGSLVVIASVYGVVVFGTAQFIFGLHFSIASQIYISAATGLAVLTFGGVKRNFDRWSNRLFYRDAYDTQALFDNLNQTLVASLDLTRLMTDISTLLAKTFKADYCLMGLKESIGTPQRIVGSEKRDVSFKDIMALRKHTVAYHRQVIVTDDLEDKKFAELKRVLARNNIAVLIRLAPNVQRSEEGLGYVALGNKKSGNPYSQQDIRVLETVANELIIAVQNALHFEEIQNFNTTLQEKITDATRQLRRTNEKLKALDETKDDFISMASHQLRTPLTSVKGYVSLVLDGDAGPLKPMQRELLTQAFASSQRMVYLISDLLNVSRLRTGKFVIDPAPVNLADMIEEELAQLKEAAETRSVELSYSKPAHFPTLMLDETKTRQVIMNFVDNAIYYTPAGGHIKVELADKPHGIELKVVDDGIGVPKHEQHHLFTKFYRAGNARKARPDGTGLGLFMAKKVVVSQGGSIVFDSQEGKGSTFGFTFAKAGHVPENTPAITP
ncbi:MAG TPA: ATP-binding protein [Candidatus Saccharimonadales bacterium]|nr:ATP-binding protein [Candidatus Saccharimonadales bacterium]